MIIDLGSRNTSIGTANTHKTLATTVAVDKVTGEIVAFGDDAEALRDRLPDGVALMKPVSRGAITDLDLASRFLELASKDLGSLSLLKRGGLKVLTPCKLSRLEQNVLTEAVSVLGRNPSLVPDCLACAASENGAEYITSAEALAVVNLGAEKSEAAVFAGKNLLRCEILPLGADELTESILRGTSNEFGVDLSWKGAEQLRSDLADLTPGNSSEEIGTVNARDRISGLPVELKVASHNVRVWVEPYLHKLRAFLRRAFTNLPPRAARDVFQRGIILSGGGALQAGITAFVEEATNVRTRVVEKPIEAGVIGAESV